MTEWCNLLEQPDQEAAERLSQLPSLAHQEDVNTHVCLGVALWFDRRFTEAFNELQQAQTLQPESEDAAFWLGMAYASLGRDLEATEALDRALSLQLPHILLRTLTLLEHECPAFFRNTLYR